MAASIHWGSLTGDPWNQNLGGPGEPQGAWGPLIWGPPQNWPTAVLFLRLAKEERTDCFRAP